MSRPKMRAKPVSRFGSSNIKMRDVESEGDYSSRFHVFKEQDLSSGQIFRMLSWMVTRIELQVRDLNTRAAVISYDL